MGHIFQRQLEFIDLGTIAFPNRANYGSTEDHSSFRGEEREFTIDTDKWTILVHDGESVGGFPQLREDQLNLPSSGVVNGLTVPSDDNLSLVTGSTDRVTIDDVGLVRITGTEALKLPVGTTGERPSSPETGMLRYSSTDGGLEVYTGAGWSNFAGSTVTTFGPLAWTVSVNQSIAHGLGVAPQRAELFARALAITDGYAIGDEIPVNLTSAQGLLSYNSTTLTVRLTTVSIPSFTLVSTVTITPSSTDYDLYVKLWS